MRQSERDEASPDSLPAIGLAAFALLAPPAASPAGRRPRIARLTATPTLFPAYSPDLHDYVVRCGASKTVRFATSAAAGTTSLIDGTAAHTEAVKLTPGAR